jgi:hypothetical protein
MVTHIPTGADIRALLRPHRQADILELAALSKVPFKTLLKIKYGATVNPGINTVAQFYPTLMTFRSSSGS